MNKTRGDEKPRRRAPLEFDPKALRRLDANTTVRPEMSDQLCLECYFFSLIPRQKKKQDLNKQVLLRKKKNLTPAVALLLRCCIAISNTYQMLPNYK